MVRWVVGSILHGGPIELFLVPASAPRRITKAVVCEILSMGPLLRIGKSSPCGGSGFLNGPLPYVRRHITINKMCRVRR